jgi:hypothetical protein
MIDTSFYNNVIFAFNPVLPVLRFLGKCPHRTEPDTFLTLNTFFGIYRGSIIANLRQRIGGTDPQRGAMMILGTTFYIN